MVDRLIQLSLRWFAIAVYTIKFVTKSTLLLEAYIMTLLTNWLNKQFEIYRKFIK